MKSGSSEQFVVCSFVADGSCSQLGFKTVTMDSNGGREPWQKQTSKTPKKAPSSTDNSQNTNLPIHMPYVCSKHSYVRQNMANINNSLLLAQLAV